MSSERETHIFSYGHAGLAYHIAGSGPRILITFHGFGQTRKFYQAFEQALSDRYTLYSIDLFFHGKSTWAAKDRPLTKTFWKEMFGAFLQAQGIDRFSLAGFSMGGKFALASLEAFPGRVEKLILMAPDGIKTSFWYSLATYPSWARGLFRKAILKPKLFYSMVQWLGKLGVVDKGILRFAASQMDSREKRKRVYYSWIVFKPFSFDLKYMGALINRYHIELEIYTGRFDKIITAKNMGKLLKWVDAYQLEILESGHNKLIDETALYFKNLANTAVNPRPEKNNEPGH